jgi:hypothetical protein
MFSEDIATDVTVQIGDAVQSREELDVLDKFGKKCFFAWRFVFSAALLNRRDEVMHSKVNHPGNSLNYFIPHFSA